MIKKSHSGKEGEKPVEKLSQQPNPKVPQESKWKRRLLFWGSSVFLVSLGGGLIYGWFFIQRQLVPLVETEVTDFLNRPVKIGSLKSISPIGARFGASEISSTPTDPAKIVIPAVDVTFNPFRLLVEGELQLNITAIQPDIYLEQGQERKWLLTKFDAPSNRLQGGIKVNVNTLQLQDAEAILAARSPSGQLQTPVKVLIDSGKAYLRDRGKLIEFKVSGELANGGEIEVSGTGIPRSEAINLLVQGSEIQATDVDHLLILPFDVQAGKVAGNLEVKIRPKQLARINGVANLQAVTVHFPALTQPFAQSDGQLRFQGTEISLEEVTTRFGSIPGIANGTIDLEKGYAIAAKTQPVAIPEVIKTLKIKKPPVPILGEIQADIQVTGLLDRPKLSLDVITTQQSRVDRVDFRPGSTANIQLIESNLSITNFQATPTVGGKLTGTGKIEFGRQGASFGGQGRQGDKETRGQGRQGRGHEREDRRQKSDYVFDLQAINVPAKAIARLYQNPLTIDPGLVSGRAQFLGRLENPEDLQAKGSANFRLGGGTVSASDFQFADGRWQGKVQTSGVSIASLNVNTSPQVRQGRVNGTFDVAGTLDSFKLEAIRATGSANIAIADGLVTANHLTLANGRWVTDLQAKELQLDRLLSNVPPQFDGMVHGTFNLAGSVKGSLQDLQGSGQGSLVLSEGKLIAENVKIVKSQFKAAIAPNGIALKQFSQSGRGTLEGKINVYGSLNNTTLKTVRADGDLRFSDGIGAIAQPLTAAISWNGQRLNIQRATAPGIQASGWAEIATESLGTTDAIEQFELQVIADRVDLKTFSIPKTAKLNYSGNLDFNGVIAGSLQAPKIEGDLALANLQIAGLAFDRTLTGTVKGIPEEGIKLNLAGREDQIELTLDRNYQPASFNVELDRMSVSGIRQNEQLQIEANNLQVGLFPEIAKASQIALPQTVLSQKLSGDLSGNFVFNLKTSELSGEQIAIANPHFGNLKGDRLTGNFRYLNSNFTLKNAQFQKNESQYLLNGSLTNTQRGPQWQAEIAVSQGQIQDVLETLQIFELSDFARGLEPPAYDKAIDLYSDQNNSQFTIRPSGSAVSTRREPPRLELPHNSQLNTFYSQHFAPSLPLPLSPRPLLSIGTPEASVQEQLSRLSEIETLLRMQRKKRQEASPLPEIAELKGTFAGKVAINSTPNAGLKASFDLQGKAWQWRDFAFNQIDLKGGFHNGIVSLEPLKIQSGESLFAFTGSVGGKIPSGEMQLANVPLELISALVDLPPTITVGGLLNGNVSLSGSRDNPQAKGELAIAKATINQTALSTTQGSFTYDNSRLNFQASSKLNAKAEPIIMQGSIPYQLPFATVKPDSDRLQLNLQVKNEGMALLNILSRDAIAWMDGQGEIALDISGRFDQQQNRPSQLRAEGIATFNQATIAVRAIPEAPLTAVNGKILFNFDRVEIESLKGKFSGGEVLVAGTLPLVQAVPQQNPLAITLDNLALNLKGLYQGGVQGEVTIAGSALQPDIGGKLNLSNGRVLLGEGNGEENSLTQNGFGSISPEFNNLKLTLGDNIQLVRPPILNFLATGSLTLNGSFDRPRPQGQITLKSGQVNLFASQLRLDTGEENTAQFSPSRGLDPYLNVQLRTSASETTRNAVGTNPSSTEISDPFTANLDSLQTVRIRARIEGYASQLANSIELTSTPPRSQREIVTLLGGGFVNTLGRGDTTLGLANLAGSAVFGGIQGAISDRLGLSEFRIFSTPLINEEERISRDRIGIAAEAGIDITGDVSFSVLKILNTDRPPQFGLQYRINDNTVIRGSTNFSDDSRAIIEYEQRF